MIIIMLQEQIVSGAINLNPEYHCGRQLFSFTVSVSLIRVFLAVVWGEANMISFIDSLLRNLYTPPIIFAVHSSRDGADTWVCIDGKQRLTSIQK